MSRAILLTIIPLWLVLGVEGRAQSLPKVESADWKVVRSQCRRLLEVLRKETGTLPAEVEQKLAELLRKESGEDALEPLQDLLDPLCLVAININPESRVKAARGPASAELQCDRPRIVLIKVNNDAGITHHVAVEGDEVRTAGRSGKGRWLEAVIRTEKPLARTLSGGRLEYVVLQLTARETGKREATLKFDAGQGTQDLGFRAEVPILFRVRPAPR